MLAGGEQVHVFMCSCHDTMKWREAVINTTMVDGGQTVANVTFGARVGGHGREGVVCWTGVPNLCRNCSLAPPRNDCGGPAV
jgi:hypothetical protein